MAPSVWGFMTVCFTVTLAVPSWAACPQGWARQGFKCTGLFLEQLEWKEAEASCRSFYNENGERGHLLSLADVKETMLLSLMMDEAQLDGMWTGLARQDDSDMALKWSNGLPSDLFSLLDNELLDISAEGDCIQASVDGDQPALWSTDCDARQPYACELSDCPQGWTSYSGSCFKYFDEGKPWTEAEDSCQGYRKDQVEGHLVSIATEDENRFLTEWQKATSGNENLVETWIGLYDPPGRDRFLWTAERDFGSEGPADLQRKAPGGCMEMHKDGEGVWSQASDCDQHAAYICKMSGCPVGLVAFQDRCLLYLGEPDTTIEEKPMGLTMAQPHRSSRNRRSFDFSKFTNRFKMSRSSTSKSAVKTPAITSKFSFSNLWGKKTSSKPSSTRTLGSTAKKSPFSKLKFKKSFQFSRSRSNGGKVPFIFGAALKKPAQSKGVISQSNSPPAAPRPQSPAQSVPAEIAPAPARSAPAQSVPSLVTSPMNRPIDRPTVSSSKTTSCPTGWTKQGSSCYKFVTIEEKSWNDAESYCNSADLGEGFRDYQAHLVIIENVLENLLLGLMVKGQASGAHVWIGKKKSGGQNSWIVDEGSVFNAVSVQTDDATNGCAYINQKAEWGHKGCSEKLRFFCEFKKTEKYKRSAVAVPDVQESRAVQPPFSFSSSRSSSSSSSSSAVAAAAAPKAAGTSEKKYCFPTWKEFGDSCYHFSKMELPWEEAKDKCRTYFFGNNIMEQANLVSIASAEEDDFLVAQSSSSSPFWIGRLAGTMWLDGGVVGYRALEINTASPGMCSYAANKQWGYQECGHKSRYVCKMPKATVARVVRKKRSIQ